MFGRDFMDAGLDRERIGGCAFLAMTEHGRSACLPRSISFVDRIMRGAKPGDLPVELPTKFDLILNLKTLRAIGINVPKKVLLQATEVIE